MRMIKTVDASALKRVFAEHARRIKLSETGPGLVADNLNQDLYEKFSNSPPSQELANLFASTETQEVMRQILFTSFLLNLQSQPFSPASDYCPSKFSVEIVSNFSTAFRQIFADVLVKSRLNEFTDTGKRAVEFLPNESKFLNAFVFPNVRLLHVFSATNLNAKLNSVKEYLFKNFPAEMGVPKAAIDYRDATSIPLFRWYFFGSFNGIQTYMMRLNTNEFAIMFDFDLPFILPLGRYTKHRMINVFKTMLQNYSLMRN
jgi:hypothetical protein